MEDVAFTKEDIRACNESLLQGFLKNLDEIDSPLVGKIRNGEIRMADLTIDTKIDIGDEMLRAAVYSAHGGKCYYSPPHFPVLPFRGWIAQIDHIIPEKHWGYGWSPDRIANYVLSHELPNKEKSDRFDPEVSPETYRCYRMAMAWRVLSNLKRLLKEKLSKSRAVEKILSKPHPALFNAEGPMFFRYDGVTRRTKRGVQLCVDSASGIPGMLKDLGYRFAVDAERTMVVAWNYRPDSNGDNRFDSPELVMAREVLGVLLKDDLNSIKHPGVKSNALAESPRDRHFSTWVWRVDRGMVGTRYVPSNMVFPDGTRWNSQFDDASQTGDAILFSLLSSVEMNMRRNGHLEPVKYRNRAHDVAKNTFLGWFDEVGWLEELPAQLAKEISDAEFCDGKHLDTMGKAVRNPLAKIEGPCV